ncbi:hypothetical protein D3C77_433170 [compost metagenome]
MNISGRLAVWCCCFALFISGVVWSALFYDLKVSFLKDAIEVGSFIATIVAAGVAVVTLTAWRKQWEYSAAQDALKRLHSALDNLSCAPSYLKAFACWKLCLGKNNPGDLIKMYETLEDQLHNELKQASKDYFSALQDVHLHFDKHELVEFLTDRQLLSDKITASSKEIMNACSLPTATYEVVWALATLHGSSLQGLIYQASQQVEEMRKQQLRKK